MVRAINFSSHKTVTKGVTKFLRLENNDRNKIIRFCNTDMMQKKSHNIYHQKVVETPSNLKINTNIKQMQNGIVYKKILYFFEMYCLHSSVEKRACNSKMYMYPFDQDTKHGMNRTKKSLQVEESFHHVLVG